MRRLHARRYDTVRAAYDAGIPVFVGTDAGGSLPHGLVAEEVAELVRAGLPPWPRCPPPPGGPGGGSAAPGWTRGPPPTWWSTRSDPRADVRVLAAPRRVVLRGRVVG